VAFLFVELSAMCMWLFVSNLSETDFAMSNARTYPGVSRQSLITKTATVVKKEKNAVFTLRDAPY
jgi:hypothetical protein